MTTSEQRKVIELLSKSEKAGIAVIKEKDEYSIDKKIYDITLLTKERTHTTLVIDSYGKVNFYESARTLHLSEGHQGQKKLDAEKSAYLCKQLQLPESFLEKILPKVSIKMLNKFYLEANSKAESPIEKEISPSPSVKR